MTNFWENLSKKSKRMIGGIISFIILTISGLLIGDQWPQIRRYIYTQQSPYIAIVMSENFPDFPVPSEFLNGFKEAVDYKEYIKNIYNQVILIKYFDDFGSPGMAQEIAKRLCYDKNCILVVGNSNSTLTESTLDVFLKNKNSPPLIMPIATSNELIMKAKTAKYKAILRLPANNKKQAEAIISIIKMVIKRHNSKIAIYADSDNPFYSINLSRDVANIARKVGAVVLAEETIGQYNSFYSSISLYQNHNKPDIIIYNGLGHHGLLLMDQLENIGSKIPIILSDGCMATSIINYIKGDKEVYIVSTAKIKKENQYPTYSSYGYDTFKLIEKVLNKIDIINRENLVKFISEKKDKIELKIGKAGSYKFDEFGENISAIYSIYKIENGKLKFLNIERKF